MDARTIRKCHKYVCSIQRNLDRAVAENDKKKIRWLTYRKPKASVSAANILTKKSRAVKTLAIHCVYSCKPVLRVTVENKGKHTAGIDGIKVVEGKGEEVKEYNKDLRGRLFKEAGINKKPSAIRRVHIKKPNGKLRPLGIPTLLDRVTQDMVKMAIEPITEYHASGNSYGFRPKRNGHDAIDHLFKKLARRRSHQWVIEGDIKGCFDNIAHDHILENLEEWNTPEYIRTTIERMLRARIFEQGTYIDPEKGTPQGGILSPMLANVALTTLDRHCEQYSRYNPIVRYADDFVSATRSCTN